jgi:undecaprenyl pyrophosphate phosphatase UppP
MGDFQEMNNMRNRYLLIGLMVIAACVVVYVVGVLYQNFVNNPLDFAALVFIVLIYAGALYHHLQRSEG